MELLGCATPEGLVLVKCTFAFTLHWKEQNFDADHVLDGLEFFLQYTFDQTRWFIMVD